MKHVQAERGKRVWEKPTSIKARISDCNITSHNSQTKLSSPHFLFCTLTFLMRQSVCLLTLLQHESWSLWYPLHEHWTVLLRVPCTHAPTLAMSITHTYSNTVHTLAIWSGVHIRKNLTIAFELIILLALVTVSVYTLHIHFMPNLLDGVLKLVCASLMKLKTADWCGRRW